MAMWEGADTEQFLTEPRCSSSAEQREQEMMEEGTGLQ